MYRVVQSCTELYRAVVQSLKTYIYWVPALICFFHYFVPFLAKSWPFNGTVWRGQICEQTNFFHFSARSEKIWWHWPATAARFFFSARLTFFHISLFNHRAAAGRTPPTTSYSTLLPPLLPPPRGAKAILPLCCRLSTHRATATTLPLRVLLRC